MPEQFFFHFWPSPRVTSTPPRLLRTVRVSTSSELYPNTRLFLNAQTSSFLIRSLVTYRMPCHARDHPHSYLGKQKIFLGVAVILSMCLCPHTWLDCNQFAITPRFIFMHVKTAKVLRVVKTFIKKYRAAVTLFRSHENIEQQPH